MKDITKVLMFGDRTWTRHKAIVSELRRLSVKYGYNNLVIIEGGARGADQIVAFCAREMNIHVVEVKALWDTRHKSAGPQRNEIMAALGPHEAVGFHTDIENSSVGTKGMRDILVAQKVPVKIVHRHI